MSFLFSSGLRTAIPDDALYQYPVSTFGTSTWTDDVGSADMSVNGLSSSTFDNGESSVSAGVSDYGLADGPQTLPENEQFGMAFTAQFTSTGGFFFGSDTASGSGPRFWIRDSGDGGISVRFADTNEHNIGTVTDSTYNDGTPHAIIINKTGDNASDINVYVDDMTNPTSTTIDADQNFDHTNYSNSAECGFFILNATDAIENGKAYDAGIFDFRSAPYSQSERDGFVGGRPEV